MSAGAGSGLYRLRGTTAGILIKLEWRQNSESFRIVTTPVLPRLRAKPRVWTLLQPSTSHPHPRLLPPESSESVLDSGDRPGFALAIHPAEVSVPGAAAGSAGEEKRREKATGARSKKRPRRAAHRVSNVLTESEERILAGSVL